METVHRKIHHDGTPGNTSLYGDGRWNTLYVLIEAYRFTRDTFYLDIFDQAWSLLEQLTLSTPAAYRPILPLSLCKKCFSTCWLLPMAPPLRLEAGVDRGVLRRSRGVSGSGRLRRCQPAPIARPRT
jgi:hypothetical protein